MDKEDYYSDLLKKHPFAQPEIILTEDEWRVKLNPSEFAILREKDTEHPYKGEYDKHFEKGVYNCRGCGTPLFTSEQKYDSGCGWPAFFDAIPGAVSTQVDDSYGTRVEIMCRKCGGHLGHVFKGQSSKTGVRHCVNSASLKFALGDKPSIK